MAATTSTNTHSFEVLVVNAMRQSNMGSAKAISERAPKGGIVVLSEWGRTSLVNPGRYLKATAPKGITLDFVADHVHNDDPTGVAWDTESWERVANSSTGTLRLNHREARSILVILKHKTHNKKIYVVSVHMWLENKKDLRKKAIGKLHELARALDDLHDGIVIIAGDFNKPVSQVAEALEPLRFKAVTEHIENVFVRDSVVATKGDRKEVRFRKAEHDIPAFDHPFQSVTVELP